MLPEASTQDWGWGALTQWGLLASTLLAITGMYVLLSRCLVSTGHFSAKHSKHFFRIEYMIAYRAWFGNWLKEEFTLKEFH